MPVRVCTCTAWIGFKSSSIMHGLDDTPVEARACRACYRIARASREAFTTSRKSWLENDLWETLCKQLFWVQFLATIHNFVKNIWFFRIQKLYSELKKTHNLNLYFGNFWICVHPNWPVTDTLLTLWYQSVTGFVTDWSLCKGAVSAQTSVWYQIGNNLLADC